MATTRRGLVLRLAGLAAGAVATGCDGYPSDTGDSLARARAGGPLRVGWSTAEPWVRRPQGRERSPGGVEPVLLRAWAARLGTALDWIEGGQDQLVAGLAAGTLDLAAAGFTDPPPWGARAGWTQPYTRSAVVLATAPGVPPPADWTGVEVHYDARRADLAAAIAGLGAVPVPAPPDRLGPLAAVYAPEAAPLGLLPVGRRLRREHRLIGTGRGEHALTLALDRFLHDGAPDVAALLAVEARA